MSWIFKDGIPIYQQIIQGMQDRIASGAYAPGSRLPSVRELALEAGVNPNTMQRALAEMERSGLLHAERTAGRYVTTDTKALAQLRASLADACIQEMFEKLSRLGFDRQEAMQAILASQTDPDAKEGGTICPS